MIRWIVLLCVLLSRFYIFAFHLDDIPETAGRLNGYERGSVELRLQSMPLNNIEGIWQFPSDGALVVIERFIPDNYRDDGVERYRLVVVQSPRLSVRPGTIMGYMIPSAKKGYYDARIYTSFDGGINLNTPKKFILKHSDDARLSFVEHKTGVKVNLWRMVPYMFRYSISKQDNRPEEMNGCIKIFPKEAEFNTTPRYL